MKFGAYCVLNDWQWERLRLLMHVSLTVSFSLLHSKYLEKNKFNSQYCLQGLGKQPS